jgi:hypothetical protein
VPTLKRSVYPLVLKISILVIARNEAISRLTKGGLREADLFLSTEENRTEQNNTEGIILEEK